MSDDEEEKASGVYYVEEVLDVRRRAGQLQFLVKWSGFPDSENTWEPEENFTSTLIDDFLEAHEMRKKSKPQRRRSTGDDSSESIIRHSPKRRKKPAAKKRKADQPALPPLRPRRSTGAVAPDAPSAEPISAMLRSAPPAVLATSASLSVQSPTLLPPPSAPARTSTEATMLRTSSSHTDRSPAAAVAIVATPSGSNTAAPVHPAAVRVHAMPTLPSPAAAYSVRSQSMALQAPAPLASVASAVARPPAEDTVHSLGDGKRLFVAHFGSVLSAPSLGREFFGLDATGAEVLFPPPGGWEGVYSCQDLAWRALYLKAIGHALDRDRHYPKSAYVEYAKRTADTGNWERRARDVLQMLSREAPPGAAAWPSYESPLHETFYGVVQALPLNQMPRCSELVGEHANRAIDWVRWKMTPIDGSVV